MSEGERVILALMASEHRVFSIDSEGCIWRHKVYTRSGNRRPVSERRADLVKPDGYRSVRVAFNGREYQALAHRLVWISRHGDIPDNLEVNHKDGQRGDNRPANLELVTKSQNLQHAYDVLGRTRAAGERNGRSKLTAEQAREIRQRIRGGSARRALAREFKVSPVVIRKIERGVYWRDEFPTVAVPT